MTRGYITRAVQKDIDGFGVVFELLIDITNETLFLPRENIKGNHWCIGWHGWIKLNEHKEIEFYPDR